MCALPGLTLVRARELDGERAAAFGAADVAASMGADEEERAIVCLETGTLASAEPFEIELECLAEIAHPRGLDPRHPGTRADREARHARRGGVPRRPTDQQWPDAGLVTSLTDLGA